MEQTPKLTKMEAKNTNAQVLAFVGDAVHTLFVKTTLVLQVQTKSGGLHTRARGFVNAGAQALVASVLENSLLEEELEVFKRARNYKTHSTPKNASVMDYKLATAFEAVVGYLYLTNQTQRLEWVLAQSMEIVKK